MLRIEFTFNGGRYHATPWGSHVNEGAVEWPPSPWRICRALLATGFSKLGWQEDNLPPTADRLFSSLASVSPAYTLPKAVVAHSRHYMPTRDTTTKVLDTFAYVGSQPIAVHWPVQLDGDARDLLRDLVESLSYLGRAESWVSARLLDESEAREVADVVPCDGGPGPDRGYDQVPVLSPLSVNEYDSWRSQTFAHALALEEAKGKVTKAARQKLEDAFPATLMDCLLSRTSVVRAAGWSQAPGSRKVLYWLPSDSLEAARPKLTRTVEDARPHECALLSLSSDTVSGRNLPLLSRVLPQAEILHRQLAKRLGEGVECPELTGKEDGSPLRGHQHAHYIPVCLTDPRRIDHIVVYAPGGLGREAQVALNSLRRTFSKGIDQKIFVTVTGLASRTEVNTALQKAGVRNVPFATSRKWITMTPFVAPRFVKFNGKNTIEGQVRTELSQRGGFPEPLSVICESGEVAANAGFYEFVRARSDSSKEPPSTVPWCVTIEFDEPVPGPIALGYGSHFGLGVFVPA